MTDRVDGARRSQRIRRQRIAAGAGVVVFLAFVLGCMSIQLGGRNEVIQSDVLTGLQTGTLSVPPGTVLEVYYPIPYQSPPNLTVENSWQDCVILEQKADHFKVKNPSGMAREVTWKARGLKTVSAQPVATPTPPDATVLGASSLQ